MKLTFFHQKRKDDAVRTGIEVEDEIVLQKFTPKGKESDASLLWYVDVRCVIDDPIEPTPNFAREILVSIGEPVQRALIILADDLRAGLDSDVWPLRRKIENLPVGIRAEVVCSAMKRITDGQLAQVTQELGTKWKQILADLDQIEVLT